MAYTRAGSGADSERALHQHQVEPPTVLPTRLRHASHLAEPARVVERLRGLVLAVDGRDQDVEPAGTRGVDDVVHEGPPDAAALPALGHVDGQLGRVAVPGPLGVVPEL